MPHYPEGYTIAISVHMPDFPKMNRDEVRAEAYRGVEQRLAEAFHLADQVEAANLAGLEASKGTT